MAAAPTYGQISAFQPEEESIQAYLERIDLYFLANDIEADKQVPVFLSVLGGKNYTLLRNLLAPARLSDQTLDNLKATLKQHFEPTRVVVAERFHFYHCNQAAGKTIADFVAELCRLKGCSHGHCIAHRMHIQSGLSVHMNPTWNPMRIECALCSIHLGSWFWSGLKILIMSYVRLRPPWDLWPALWLGFWCAWYCFFLFCSCNDVGEERGLFSDGREEWYRMINRNHDGSIVPQLLWCITAGHSATWAGQVSEEPSSIVLVSWCRFFSLCSISLLCITPTLDTIHFESAYLLCHVNAIDAHRMQIQFDSDAHRNRITTSFMWTRL